MMDFLSLNNHTANGTITADFENILPVDCVLRWVFRFQERWAFYEEVLRFAIDGVGVG